MKVYISLYARPLTREIFDLYYDDFGFDKNDHWSESVHIFMSDSFWEYFIPQMDIKSLYKINMIIEITPYTVYDNYYGVYEYDEDVMVDSVLVFAKSKTFSDLRSVVSQFHHNGEIL